MDISVLTKMAEEAIGAIQPYLPTIAGKAAEKIGEGIPDAIRDLWNTIKDRFSKRKATEASLDEFVGDPSNDDIQEVFLSQLRRLLREDKSFAFEIEEALKSVQAAQNTDTQIKHSTINYFGNGDGSHNELNIGSNSGAAMIIIGNENHMEIPSSNPLSSAPLPADLRISYLNHLYENNNFVTLAGIDPQAAGNIEASLNLASIYTALFTQTQESRDSNAWKAMREVDEFHNLSAVDCINRHKHLVILGDPGSGKSTFINYISLCLAGELLGKKEANLSVLMTPVIQYSELLGEFQSQKGQALKYQAWDHGSLIPVKVILQDFAARGLPPTTQITTATHLWSFIEKELADASLMDYAPYLRKELIEKGGMILLDGLDEVPSAEMQRTQIKQVVDDFTAAFPKCRIILTSRIYAYQNQDWRLRDFTDVVLAPFNTVQISELVDRYYQHIAEISRIDILSAQGRAQLLKKAILNNQRLADLAERPLLLTLIISIHAWRGGNLPEDRQELYEQAVELLLDLWERNKWGRNFQGEIVVRRQSIAEYLKADRKQLRQLLDRLAFDAHSNQRTFEGLADIPNVELIKGLMNLSHNMGNINPQLLEKYLRERAGLLIERGNNVYAFPHRTFQEYLAACYLTNHEDPMEIANLARKDPVRWHEVVLLAGAKAARGMNYAVWSLAQELCPTRLNSRNITDENAWGALLAGQCLFESANLQKVSTPNNETLQRVREWLVYIIEKSGFPVLERVSAGNFLARLGDSRFLPNYWYLTADSNLGFIEIPKGSFLMGSSFDDPLSSSDEHPSHEVWVGDYYLSRYPVTVSQYQEYLRATNREPKIINNPQSNHPIVNVSFEEALEYCDWLQVQLSEDSRTPKVIATLLRSRKWHLTLPSEAEWEKAARGTEGLQFPWGNTFDLDKANIDETNLAFTSPVGTFPNGVSPYKVLDMSGNVWEWTRSIPRAYPYKFDDGRESLEVKAKRSFRGGSFEDIRRVCRCASRDSASPEERFPYCGFRLALVPY